MSDNEKPAVMEAVDEPQPQYESPQPQYAAPQYEASSGMEQGGQAPSLPQKTGPGGMMMVASVSLPDAVIAPFTKRIMILRLVQIVLVLLGGILTVVPISFQAFGVSTSVAGPAWPLVSGIFASIWGGLTIFSLRKHGISQFVSPIPLAIEFLIIIFVFSGAVQSAQWAAGINGILVPGVSSSGAVSAVGAVFMWLAWATFIASAFLIYQITTQLQRLNQVDYFARPRQQAS